MKNNFFKFFILLLPVLFFSSGCSDFRQAIGKEKKVPDEFSAVLTPSLIVPPGYKIDPDVLKNNNVIDKSGNALLIDRLNIKKKENGNNPNNFEEVFGSKNVPQDIRQIVDKETIGIGLSERTGINILFGTIPETGTIVDTEKEALRIRKNKTLGKSIKNEGTPAFNKNSRKSILIK
jgi:hypothetical protein